MMMPPAAATTRSARGELPLSMLKTLTSPAKLSCASGIGSAGCGRQHHRGCGRSHRTEELTTGRPDRGCKNSVGSACE